jgi:putative flippase GtrA
LTVAGLSASQIAARYVAFALVATALNFASQALVTQALGYGAILVALAVGTITGLLVKFELDRRWIFRFVPRDTLHHGGTFGLYAATGIATTAIFWGAELAADRLIGGPLGRYAGGAAGLAVGYFVKYRLDKKFVFAHSSPDGRDER